MRFVCESCRAQYMINDEKVGPKGVKVRCRKCGYVITVKRAEATGQATVMPGPSAEAERGVPPDPSASSPLAEGPGRGSVKDTFLGADADEIGAVFDQVLTGQRPAVTASAPGGESAEPAAEGLDQGPVVLGSEAGEEGLATAAEPAPESNWFVAIDEKQTGPLSLEKVKEHWDRGEVGPDSLCWREGFADWVPLAKVASLGAVLAPKPPRPIVVPATTVPVAPAVVSAPVQSAFSAGGVVQAVQSEVQVPLPAAAAEQGAWRPGAASSLASLVKDELDALARPPRPSAPAPAAAEPARPAATLLDLPEERPAPQRPSSPPPAQERAATNPYLAPPPPAPSYGPPAAAPPASSRGLLIGLSVGGGALVLGLLGVVGWLALRPAAVAPAVVVPAPVAPPAASPAPTPPPVAATPEPPAAAVPLPAATTPPPVTPAPPVTPPPVAVVRASPPPAPAVVKEPIRATAPPPPRKDVKVARSDPAAAEPARPAEGGGDEFDRAFGGTAKPVKREEPTPEPARKKDVYVPPAPGAGADVKDSLGKSDIMEVILAEKASFARCIEEQRQREPGAHGSLVLRWQILSSGKVSGVTVVTEEFRNTSMATCVSKVVKGLSFPRHRVQGEPINFPFNF